MHATPKVHLVGLGAAVSLVSSTDQEFSKVLMAWQGWLHSRSPATTPGEGEVDCETLWILSQVMKEKQQPPDLIVPRS